LGAATISSDVAEEPLPRDRDLGLDEGVDGAPEDLGIASGVGILRPTEDGLHSAGSEEQKRRKSVHGGLKEAEAAGGEVGELRGEVRLKSVEHEAGHRDLYL
jgi:hypothetical protein